MKLTAGVALSVLLLASCAGASWMPFTGGEPATNSADRETLSAPGATGFSAEIRRTMYGIPHIKANDIGGIGYGFGYASAEDNICEILDRVMTVSATRARYLGPGAKDANIESDVYHARLNQLNEIDKLLKGAPDSPDTPSADARRLAAGYIAGV